jgi:hypothetical protein
LPGALNLGKMSFKQVAIWRRHAADRRRQTFSEISFPLVG